MKGKLKLGSKFFKHQIWQNEIKLSLLSFLFLPHILTKLSEHLWLYYGYYLLGKKFGETWIIHSTSILGSIFWCPEFVTNWKQGWIQPGLDPFKGFIKMSLVNYIRLFFITFFICTFKSFLPSRLELYIQRQF